MAAVQPWQGSFHIILATVLGIGAILATIAIALHALDIDLAQQALLMAWMPPPDGITMCQGDVF
ncbi:hypothetical protein NBRC116598_31210 [Pseudophaeobacter arcticus]|uniref:Uncharacterized protein n=1 Tax=Pseudophaeobacter arcticus TaxID=385492 RepID=A0ABQ0AP63_9RHOB